MLLAVAEPGVGCLRYIQWPPPLGCSQNRVPTPYCPYQVSVCGREVREEGERMIKVRGAKSKIRTEVSHGSLFDDMSNFTPVIWD